MSVHCVAKAKSSDRCPLSHQENTWNAPREQQSAPRKNAQFQGENVACPIRRCNHASRQPENVAYPIRRCNHAWHQAKNITCSIERYNHTSSWKCCVYNRSLKPRFTSGCKCCMSIWTCPVTTQLPNQVTTPSYYIQWLTADCDLICITCVQ